MTTRRGVFFLGLCVFLTPTVVSQSVVEDCSDGIDNDADGMVDMYDSDCAAPLGGGACDSWAFYFGATATGEDVDASSAESLSIGMRNAMDAFAFQFGVAVRQEGQSFRYSFSGELGADAERIVELVITENTGYSQAPFTANTAVASALPASVERGASITEFADGDLFAFDLEPGVGGPGFTVGYIADLDGDENRIPATPDEAGCPLNEIVTIRFGEPPPRPFIRGDMDGSSRVDITDAVLVIQVVLQNLPRRYDCEKALDADDDGVANITDAIAILRYMFLAGDLLAAPFPECGADQTVDDLHCREANVACAE